MTRRNALGIAALLAVTAVAGSAALGNTLGRGEAARQSSDNVVAQRAAQLDRFAQSLQKKLASLPRVPASDPAPAPRAQRVVYVRPPAITRHVSGGEAEYGEDHEHDFDGEHGDVDD
jgi:hypothetical protein